MKIGMIFECGADGADKPVCVQLAKRIDPTLQIISRTLDDKQNLISKCGSTSAQLLELGCERVAVVWDLRPAWPDKKYNPCLKEERNAILDSLLAAKICLERVYLVCIEQELEAWLLADERALRYVLSTPAHPVTIKRRRRVDQIKNPKSVINNLYKEYKGTRYVDRYHAEPIVLAIPDLSRLRKIRSFRRFESAISES